MSGSRYSHCRKYCHDIILSKDVTFFCLNKRSSFFLRDAIAPLLFLFMSKSVQKNAKHVEQAPLFS